MKNIIKKICALFNVEIHKKISDSELNRNKIKRLILENKWLIEKNIKTIIDIGANEGQFAQKMRLLFPNAKIISFEPITQVYQQLNENFKNDKSFISYNFGLGEKEENITMWLNEYSPSSSILKMSDHLNHFQNAKETAKINIEIKPLDKVLNKSKIETPYLTKIDVQGFEKYVIKGGQSLIKNSLIIIIEVSFCSLFENQVLFDEIYSILKSLGYKYSGNYDQLYSPVNNKILQADAIFIKENISQ